MIKLQPPGAGPPRFQPPSVRRLLLLFVLVVVSIWLLVRNG